jgi:hypothetical protein
MSESKTAREVHVKSDRQSSTAIECGGEKKGYKKQHHSTARYNQNTIAQGKEKTMLETQNIGSH